MKCRAKCEILPESQQIQAKSPDAIGAFCFEESFQRLERMAAKYMGLFYSGSRSLHVGMAHDWINGFEFPWRIRPAATALKTEAYLVRVDSLVREENAQAFWEYAMDSETMAARRREFLEHMVSVAGSLEPGQTMSSVLVPDDVTVERLQ